MVLGASPPLGAGLPWLESLTLPLLRFWEVLCGALTFPPCLCASLVLAAHQREKPLPFKFEECPLSRPW